MKRNLILALGLALVAGVAGAAISGSAHDFSGTTWALNSDGSASICVPCHAPHNNLNAATELLWNHTTSTASYTFYSSPSLDAIAATAIGAESKVCMSCHDGTVNVDAFGGTTPGVVTIATSANFGTDLGNDHPISISYCDTAAAGCTTTDPELAAKTTVYGGATIADFLFGTSGDVVECATCHDVHNGAAAATVNQKLLYESNTTSGICLKCHTK